MSCSIHCRCYSLRKGDEKLAKEHVNERERDTETGEGKKVCAQGQGKFSAKILKNKFSSESRHIQGNRDIPGKTVSRTLNCVLQLEYKMHNFSQLAYIFS